MIMMILQKLMIYDDMDDDDKMIILCTYIMFWFKGHKDILIYDKIANNIACLISVNIGLIMHDS